MTVLRIMEKVKINKNLKMPLTVKSVSVKPGGC